jgi:hypothetical protein
MVEGEEHYKFIPPSQKVSGIIGMNLNKLQLEKKQ